MPHPERSLDVKTDSSLKIRYSLRGALQQNEADVLLLSGGIDSSLLAALDPQTPAITVGLADHSTDLYFSQKVADHLGTPWYHIGISKQEGMQVINEVMVLTNSYDQAIFNTMVDYIGMKYAASLGYRIIRTGDFADELYQGYSFLYGQDDQTHVNYLIGLLPYVKLPSSVIADKLGLKPGYPYLNSVVIDNALTIPVSHNVVPVSTEISGDIYEAQFNQSSRELKIWGKIALRQAALGILPLDVVFRQKTHREFGSGFANLREDVAALVTEEEVLVYKQTGKHFYNKAHAGLYKLFKGLNLTPLTPKENEHSCTWCGGGVIRGKNHCPTCGGYPSSTHK